MNQERAWMWICHKSSKKKWNDMVYIKVYLDNSAFDEASKIKKKSSKSDKRTTKKKIWTWKKKFMQNKKEKKTKHQSIEIYRSSPVIFVTSWVPDLGLHPSYTNVLYVYIYISEFESPHNQLVPSSSEIVQWPSPPQDDPDDPMISSMDRALKIVAQYLAFWKIFNVQLLVEKTSESVVGKKKLFHSTGQNLKKSPISSKLHDLTNDWRLVTGRAKQKSRFFVKYLDLFCLAHPW